ncbi:MAG: endolytic transglycosylase MltG [Holosporales bacterium]|jgi:UPF0755 protein|nr:endolytic transglycosylase MltG [Holosporales bacterium]
MIFKIFSFLFVIFAFVIFALFETSKIEDHSVFYISDQNLYEIVKNDGAFNLANGVFFVIDNCSNIKSQIKTGEYMINCGDTVIDVVKRMITKERVRRKLTIPEGYTIAMIIEKLQQNDLLFGEIEESPKEGSLMPDTYFYHFGDTKQFVVDLMKNQMKKALAKLASSNDTKLSIDEIVTIASIIEKETALDGERSIVSSVYHNRLNKKMKLQSCPTVIYAVSQGYGKIGRDLTIEDLKFDSPFNTYVSDGLPPTAICCPGEKAILAAMKPAQTDHFYFVAKKNGIGHYFSRTYKGHLKNKNMME